MPSPGFYVTLSFSLVFDGARYDDISTRYVWTVGWIVNHYQVDCQRGITSLAADKPVAFFSSGRQLSLNEAQLNVLGAVVVDVGRSSEDTKYLLEATLLSKFALQMRTSITISLREHAYTTQSRPLAMCDVLTLCRQSSNAPQTRNCLPRAPGPTMGSSAMVLRIPLHLCWFSHLCFGLQIDNASANVRSRER